jgi:hypothetical protein
MLAQGIHPIASGYERSHGPVPVKFVDAPAGILLLKFLMLRVEGVNVKPLFAGLIV